EQEKGRGTVAAREGQKRCPGPPLEAKEPSRAFVWRFPTSCVVMWSLVGAEFRKVADQIGRKTFKARKLGLVAARKAVKAETIETRWDGKETTNTTRPGDWIVTNLSPERKVLLDNKGNENT